METRSSKEKVMMYDVIIIISYIIFAVSFLFEQVYDTVSIIAGFLLAYLFTLCVRKTNENYRKLRLRSLEYGFSFTIAFPCGLKITELLTDLTLDVDALGVVLTGIFLHSVYFVVVKKIKY